MINELKREFRGKYPNNTTANYNYEDLAEGTGIVVLYAGAQKNSSEEIFKLDKNIFEPWFEGLTGASAGAEYTGRDIRVSVTGVDGDAYTLAVDRDFDLSAFNMAKTIRGTALCNIAYSTNVQDSGAIPKAYVVVKFRKVSSSGVETEIASGTSQTLTYQYASGYFSFPVTIPLTIFNSGETLRITVEIYLKNGGGVSKAVALMFCHDPLNRAIPALQADTGSAFEKCVAVAGETQTKFLVPFRIDI